MNVCLKDKTLDHCDFLKLKTCKEKIELWFCTVLCLTLLIQQFLGKFLILSLLWTLQLQRFVSDVENLQLQLQLLCGACRVLPLSPI